jgi:Ca2+-binding RTX toxin-like protein
MLNIAGQDARLYAADDIQTLDVITGTKGLDVLDGTNGDDVIYGLGGRDEFYGGEGADLLSGGKGDDYINGDDGDDISRGGAGGDEIRDSGGDDTLLGNAGDDFLAGGFGNDRLFGGAGNDLLAGGAGDDLIDGGAGFNLAVFGADAVAGVHVDLRLQGAAQDTGEGIDTLYNIENLAGSAHDDVLIGDDASNVLLHGGGADTLIGNGGEDLFWISPYDDTTVDGGEGDDTLWIDGLGYDFTFTSVDLNRRDAQYFINLNFGTQFSVTLSGIENLTGSAVEQSDDSFYGSRVSNTLAGGEANDTLYGRGGADLLLGDGLIAYEFDQLSRTGPVVLHLEGYGEGADTLDGGASNDTLAGGEGTDVLTGGRGHDTFLFLSVDDYDPFTGPDLITDLTAKDIIDLSAIDADSAADGDQAFHIVRTFHGRAGELRASYDAGTDQTLFLLDIDGDGSADMQIAATGNQVDHTAFAL